MSTESDSPTPSDDLVALRKTTDDMIDALTSPAYVEAMRKLRAAPDDKRLDEATRRLSPDGLRELGVPIPEGMRISSRYFEPGFAEPVELGDSEFGGGTEDLTVVDAFAACTCGGTVVPPFGPTVCGGAGVKF